MIIPASHAINDVMANFLLSVGLSVQTKGTTLFFFSPFRQILPILKAPGFALIVSMSNWCLMKLLSRSAGIRQIPYLLCLPRLAISSSIYGGMIE
jgi:hypothetical protein